MSGEISAIILKVASRCNLNCSYCYIYNHEDRSYLHRPHFIDDEVYVAALRRIRQYCDRHSTTMSLTFHGGEPTLIGARRFAELAATATTMLGDCLEGLAIQTNAIRIDDDWIELFQRYEINVGVSLDGPAEIHDMARVDHAGRGSHARTIEGLHRLQAAGLDPAVLCVVNPGCCGVEVYQDFRSMDITRISFLLPDVSHDNKERFYGSFGETPVADFLIPVFDAWFGEEDADVKVVPFWGLLRVMLGGDGETDAFGNVAMGYLIVETDGAIEALDALRVCGEGIASSGLNVLNHGFDDLAQGLPLVERAVREGLSLAEKCRLCAEREVCGGGYLPHRYARANGFDNPSVWCDDILKLLRHMRASVLAEVAN